MYRRTYSVEYTMDDKSKEIPEAKRPVTVVGVMANLGGITMLHVESMAVVADSEDDAVDAVRKDCEEHEEGVFRFRSITYKGTILI